MEPSSFSVDHRTLDAGFYQRGLDRIWGFYPVKTYDLRFTAPYRQPVLDAGAIHSIEHLLAYYLRRERVGGRRNPIRHDVLYFGPMGCQTGFYVVVRGFHSPATVKKVLIGILEQILPLKSKDDIPALNETQCGNCYLYSVERSNEALAAYLNVLKQQ